MQILTCGFNTFRAQFSIVLKLHLGTHTSINWMFEGSMSINIFILNKNKIFLTFFMIFIMFPCLLISETRMSRKAEKFSYLCQVLRGTRHWVGFGNKFCNRRHVDKTFPDEVQSSQECRLNFNSSRHLWTKKMALKKVFSLKIYSWINIFST